MRVYVRSLSSQLPSHLQLCVNFSRLASARSTLPSGSLSRLPANSTKKIYWKRVALHGRLLILVRLSFSCRKHSSTSASAPGELWSTVKEISDLVGTSVILGASFPFRSMKKRVVLSALSSMHSARMSSPSVSAARLLAIAALCPVLSPFTISADRLVELSSRLSTPFKYAPRKTSHCPKACGCV